MNRSLASAALCLILLALPGCSKISPTSESVASVDSEQSARAAMIGGAADSAMPMPVDEGAGPGQGGEKYDEIIDNPFLRVLDEPLSTFSIDVDTASYSKVRQYLVNYNKMPRRDAVRIEELLNYFHYQYDGPAASQSEPFATHVAVSQCPWNEEHRLVRLALKGREVRHDRRPPSNLVLLIDASGSMKRPNKLPLLKRGMQLLLKQLGESHHPDGDLLLARCRQSHSGLDSLVAGIPFDCRRKMIGQTDRALALVLDT